jgi:branched-chain amino acid transport system ATP-binding protein
LLAAEQQKGVAILLVEQLAYAALTIADRGYVLSRGRVVTSGPARALVDDQQVHRAYLGAASHG